MDQIKKKITTLDEYQLEALRTATRDPKAFNIPRGILEALEEMWGIEQGGMEVVLEPLLAKLEQMTWAMGLAGEAGEFVDLMKKHHGHGHPLDREKALKELGDVLWYTAVLSHSLGYTLSQVAQENSRKLRERYESGFTVAESIGRKEPT